MTAPDHAELRERLERRWPAGGLRNPDGPEAVAAIAELQAQVEAMRDALAPFAKSAAYFDAGSDRERASDSTVGGFAGVTVGDIRKAHAALQPKDQSNG